MVVDPADYPHRSSQRSNKVHFLRSFGKHWRRGRLLRSQSTISRSPIGLHDRRWMMPYRNRVSLCSWVHLCERRRCATEKIRIRKHSYTVIQPSRLEPRMRRHCAGKALSIPTCWMSMRRIARCSVCARCLVALPARLSSMQPHAEWRLRNPKSIPYLRALSGDRQSAFGSVIAFESELSGNHCAGDAR